MLTMNLKNYFKEESIKEFCLKNKFNYGSFRVLIAGKYKPSPEMALRIEKATKGKVNRLELLYP
jgi:hypothetical protein